MRNRLAAAHRRVRIPWWWRVVAPFSVLWASFMTAAEGAIAWRCWTSAAVHPTHTADAEIQGLLTGALGSGLLAAFFGLACAFFVYWTVRDTLAAKREAIATDTHKLTVTDWRGREQEVLWPTIQEVRAITCAGIFKPPRILLKANDRLTQVSPWLEDRERLIEEITSRAGLALRSETWYQKRYGPRLERQRVPDGSRP